MSLGPLMVGLSGCELTPVEQEYLRHPLIGGVILFSHNIESPEQVTALVRSVHALREPHLLVAVDQEGGRVQRLRKGFTLLPAVRELGHIHDQDPRRAKALAETTGWLMATELRSVGVDISFAPVLDLDTGRSRVIGDRAFHRDPQIVAELAHAYMNGMTAAGMSATGKHFPGHGFVAADTHTAVATDERSYADLEFEDLLPFERMIHYGLPALMIAHVVYSNIDPHPAGFSPFWLRTVLRDRIGFQGAIFSDDLTMTGASVIGNVVDRAQAALDAGCDMVLVCHQIELLPGMLDDLRHTSDPVAAIRLARMHGRHSIDRGQLGKDPRWLQASRAVLAYAPPETLALI
ncbi:MAG: beta-N-acetylhexosaminidase [Gammaproteobacteria bacterium]|nr:MAG: beta-N-acetylhexosaminidase [Gammaproteobacteria bacterium]TND07008.1 MAG: beta-N-acetylhexosaminidase [Gammaproteobacteria bacterium]